MNRRDTLKLMATAPLAAGFTWTTRDLQEAHKQMQAAAQTANAAFEPSFFTDHEYETVRILADLILPADERSGSATEAGVPEFIDFMMTDRPNMQTPMRGGLAWMDAQCLKRHGKTFVDCSDAERRALLDAIAWPEEAPPELSQGVAFFNSLRDLTATGFWTSKMGIEDLQYMGNTFVHEWTGCPHEALEQLGVRYEDE